MFISIAFHPVRLSLSLPPVRILSDPDACLNLPFHHRKRTSKFRLKNCFSKHSLSNFWELPISPLVSSGSTSLSLRWLYRFCNLSQRRADSRVRPGGPHYQKPDLNDNVCRRAKHPSNSGPPCASCSGLSEWPAWNTSGVLYYVQFHPNLVQIAKTSPGPLLFSRERRQSRVLCVTHNL